MDPRLGIDTSGPGEAVFAIRFNGKPQLFTENMKFQNPKKIEEIVTIPIRILFWDELEMSSVYTLGLLYNKFLALGSWRVGPVAF